MILFPDGSRRRAAFEALDRGICRVLTGKAVTCSTYIGDLVKAGAAKPRHYLAAAFIDTVTFEDGHVFKNAGKA